MSHLVPSASVRPRLAESWPGHTICIPLGCRWKFLQVIPPYNSTSGQCPGAKRLHGRQGVLTRGVTFSRSNVWCDRSMLTLFQVTTTEGWAEIAREVGVVFSSPDSSFVKRLKATVFRWWSSNRGLRDFLFCIFMPESQMDLRLESYQVFQVYQCINSNATKGTVTFSRSRLLPFWTWWSPSLWRVRWMRQTSLMSLQRLRRFQKS